MDGFIDIGPECFTNTEKTVISYQGENYYKACGQLVANIPGGGQTFCVKRRDHMGDVHEDFRGEIRVNLKMDDEVAAIFENQVEEQQLDPSVHHPPHYTSHPSGVECIEITRHMNFNLGNVVKYVWRSGLKDGVVPIQDLEKAAWYLNDEIERRKNTKQWT